MAYVAPTTRADGYVVPASVWNQDVVNNPIAINAGAVAIASQAAGDVIVASTASQLGRVAAGASGHLLTGAGTGNPPTFVAPVLSLLKANSGTTTSAVAETVDTFAITGLTAKDTIQIKIGLEAVTASTTTITIYNVTDAVALLDVNDQGGLGPLAAGRELGAFAEIRQLQSAATEVFALQRGHMDNNGGVNTGQKTTVTTNWTGSWTIGLRHGGVTATGTLRWSWAIYKLAGQ